MLAPTAVLVAAEASRRAIGEPVDVLMLIHRLGLLVSGLRVAVDTGEAGVVRRHLVAIVTHRPVMRNREVRVIERCAQPACGGVAGVARGWVPRGDVIRHRTAQRLRAVPLRQVAAGTNRVRRGQRIVVIDVAVRAGLHASARSWHDVPASQRPTGCAVIEFSIGPQQRVVASGAQRRGEIRRNVVWHRATQSGRAVPIRGMATRVVAVRDRQVVLVSDVTLRAVGDHTRRRHLVISRQRPSRARVVEGRVGPGNAVVAGRAVRCSKRAARRRMGGIVRRLPCAEMAASVAAVRGLNIQCVVTADMALRALRHFARRS